MTEAKHYGKVSETPCFRGEIHRKSPQIVNYYGDSKLLRRSLFSTAGSFGWGQDYYMPVFFGVLGNLSSAIILA